MGLKISSRKFIITLYWLLYSIAVLAVTKEVDPTVIMITGFVSIFYISANLLQKFIDKK